ncbi:MAG: type I glyceraldehyde-3-phosphate dehydrogenase [Acidimicrobiia bacterium]
MTARVAINGFGRIGRSFLRACLERGSGLEIVAVNDTNDTKTLAYLLEYDTVHGHLGMTVEADDGHLSVGGNRIPVFHERDPAKLRWDELGITAVIESTGHFTMAAEASRHLAAGAERVVISAPATGADITICMGVNDGDFDADLHHIVSNASCTTNCLAVMASILHRSFGIDSGFMTTVHAYTNDQNLLDLPHRGVTRDLRRTRAAAQNIVPSTTGAARSIGEVIPELRGRMDGVAIRVPVACGSLVDLVCHLGVHAGVEDVNAAFREAAESSRYAGVLSVAERPLVSSDIVGDASSCIFSACDTMTRGGDVKVFGWYDNEWGYSNRLVEVTELLCGQRRLEPELAAASATPADFGFPASQIAL